jgi:branched-chain amino acid transport system ATP-binding protein
MTLPTLEDRAGKMNSVSPLLRLCDLSFSYGALKAADGISLALESGEALGIIGPNGAGKTTLLDLIMGTKRASHGRIELEGREISSLPPHGRCHLGIARSFQIPRPFSGMTVLENVLVGATRGGARSEKESVGEAIQVLERTGLLMLANERTGRLRLLERKRLELARALSTAPRVLLLDETAGGLSDMETGSLIETIRGINAEGTAIVWIEHVVHALTAVVKRLLVLDQGRVLTEGAPEAVIRSKAVQEVYLGVPT